MHESAHPTRPWIILIAGPVLSGTNGDPDLVAANMRTLEAMSLPIWQAGHIPLVGEWVAEPIITASGGKAPGDEVWQQLQYPVAHRLLDRCDAVLRLPGASRGADMDVARARERGLPVYFHVDEIPRRAGAAAA